VRRAGAAALVAVAVLTGCGREQEPPPDMLKGQRQQMEKAKDVGNVLQQGSERARDAEK
jgi:hypothetical protein